MEEGRVKKSKGKVVRKVRLFGVKVETITSLCSLDSTLCYSDTLNMIAKTL
jgi:hypothetical protein